MKKIYTISSREIEIIKIYNIKILEILYRKDFYEIPEICRIMDE